VTSSRNSHQNVKQLNALRRQAVQLRLDGNTLAEVTHALGLSAPTIISAVKSFEAGGWDAVDVAARGRPRRKAIDSDTSLQALHAELLNISTIRLNTSAVAKPAQLMNIDRFGSWLESSEHPLSRSAQVSLLNKWGLQPENRYRRLRKKATDGIDANSGNQASNNPDIDTAIDTDIDTDKQWLEHHERFTRRARRHGAMVLWLASNPVGENHNQLYAQDLRGRTSWCLVNGKVKADHYLHFAQALAADLNQPLALVFANTQLPRIDVLARWLADTSTDFLCVDESANAPSFNPTPGPTMSANPDAAAIEQLPEVSSGTLTHLQRLEAESIHIMREVVAEAENPVMMYSVGKDSAVMLHLALKAFYPAVPPFPLLHVDTTWKFKAMYEFRDNIVEKYGLELLKHTNPEGLAQNVNPFTHGSSLHTDIMKTQALKQALDHHRFDFAFGGARRDEEKSRAKERVFSFRNAQHRWDAKNQRPELWKLYNARKQRDESIRVFPLSNWTELDIWQYIYKEEIPIVPLYLAAERPVVERDGSLIMVDDERMPLKDGEVPEMRSVRFRTLGCYPLTGAVESTATTLEEIIQEMLLTRTSERQGRMIDHDSAASMEKKKQEGYF